MICKALAKFLSSKKLKLHNQDVVNMILLAVPAVKVFVGIKHCVYIYIYIFLYLLSCPSSTVIHASSQQTDKLKQRPMLQTH